MTLIIKNNLEKVYAYLSQTKDEVKTYMLKKIIWVGVLMMMQPAYAQVSQSALDQLKQPICGGLEQVAAPLMQARQKQMPQAVIKQYILKGLEQNTDPSFIAVKAGLQQAIFEMLQEVQYFPVLKDEQEQKLLAMSYQSFVGARCRAKFEA